jgi:polyhydroxyalkanoate synthase
MKIKRITVLFFVACSISISTFLGLSNAFAADGDAVLEERTGAETADVQAEATAAEQEQVKIKTEVYTVKTKDGWEISINRYNIRDGNAENCKAAVILCHGFNINNRFWDLDKRCSLARFLAKNGYDVWSPSLRGSGLSSKPIFSRLRSIVKFELEDIPQMLIKTPFDITKFGWTIDDHIHEDVPAIIDFVKEKSGFDKVYWIGHSMGGIIMFGYLETETQSAVAGFIPIGSMMVIPQPLSPHLKTIANQKPLLTASLLINTTVASQLRNLTLGTVKHPIEELLFEKENMYNDVMFRFFRSCIDDTSAGVIAQFSDSIRVGSIISSDRKYNYADNIRRINVPILIMGGSADGFVNKEALRAPYIRVSSKDKSIAIFSKENGYSADYGHCDLVIGKNSEEEVYPVILQWLDKRTKD